MITSRKSIMRWLNMRIEEHEALSQDHEMMQEEFIRAKKQFQKTNSLPRMIRSELRKGR